MPRQKARADALRKNLLKRKQQQRERLALPLPQVPINEDKLLLQDTPEPEDL
jgi:hypothetical protein